jgi:hypothetical protein
MRGFVTCITIRGCLVTVKEILNLLRLESIPSCVLPVFVNLDRSDFICLFLFLIYNFIPSFSSTHLSRLLHCITSEVSILFTLYTYLITYGLS